MTRKTMKNLTPEQKAIVEQARREWETEAPAEEIPTLSAKMQAQHEVGEAVDLRQQAKRALIAAANAAE